MRVNRKWSRMVCPATLWSLAFWGFSILAAPSLALGVSKLVYTKATGSGSQIAVAWEDGSDEVVLTTGSEQHIFPRISADGQQIVWSEGPDMHNLRLVVRKEDSGRLEEYSEARGWNLHSTFSGNGRYLVWSSSEQAGGMAALHLVDLEEARAKGQYELIQRNGETRWRFTGTPRVIAENDKLYFPNLSSDGRFLVYQRSKDAHRKEVVLYDLEADSKRLLTPENGYAMAPSLSFDDRYVAYAGRIDGNVDIFVVDTQTGDVTRLTNDEAQDAEPVFHPDGSVVFASARGEHFGLFIVKAAQIQRHEPRIEALVSSPEGDVFGPGLSGDLSYEQGVLAPMTNPPRSSFGTARVGNKIFVAGGHQGAEHTYPPESFLDLVEYYDLEDGQWHRTAPRSVACHGYSIAAHGKYVYAFGGFAYSADHLPKWKSLDLIERYDTETDRWEVVGRLPRKRSSYVLGVVDEKVYLIGGWDSTPKFDNDYNGTFHREIDVFDLSTEESSVSRHVIPDPLRRALSVVTSGDEIILVGGLGEGATHFELLDSVTAFNPKTGAWRELPKLPFATFAPAAGLIGDELYMFGGMFKTGSMDYRYVNHVFKYELGTPAWQHTGRYLKDSKGFSMVVPLSDDGLAILGGHSYDGNTDAPVQTVESFQLLRNL